MEGDGMKSGQDGTHIHGSRDVITIPTCLDCCHLHLIAFTFPSQDTRWSNSGILGLIKNNGRCRYVSSFPTPHSCLSVCKSVDTANLSQFRRAKELDQPANLSKTNLKEKALDLLQTIDPLRGILHISTMGPLVDVANSGSILITLWVT